MDCRLLALILVIEADYVHLAFEREPDLSLREAL
jgi:hypothetical protein